MVIPKFLLSSSNEGEEQGTQLMYQSCSEVPSISCYTGNRPVVEFRLSTILTALVR